MFKKLILIVIILCAVGTLILNALSNHGSTVVEPELAYHRVITDEEELSRVAEERNINIPEGYSSIESIEDFVYLIE